MISILLWDVDGTLLNFLKSEDWALRKCLAALGVAADDGMIARYSAVNQRHWQALERGEISRQQVMHGRFAEFFRVEGIACGDIPAFNLDYQTALGQVFFPNDDALALVRRLRGRVRQYAVTNGSGRAQWAKLRLSGLDTLLDGVFISEEVGAEKPDAAFFEAVLRAIGPVDKAETVIVGDSLTSDMLGGVRAGLRCWWYCPDAAAGSTPLPIERTLRDLREVEALLDSEPSND